MLSCGLTRLYKLLGASELESYHDGRSRLITVLSIENYIARRLAAAQADTPEQKQAPTAPEAMSSAPKILLAMLWQYTSERGNKYLSGFLGEARLIGVPGEPNGHGTPTWSLYVEPDMDQEGANARAQQPRRSPPRAGPGLRPRPTRVRRSQNSEGEKKPAEDRLFHDDPSADI
jgi:hypothetical protein